MEGPISFWGYKEQESNLILPEHDDDDDDDDENFLHNLSENNKIVCKKVQRDLGCSMRADGWMDRRKEKRQAGRQTDRYDEANSSVLQFCKRA